MHKKQIAGKLMIGLLAVLYMGCVQPAVMAAPVIANMPHKADGSRITGNQSVPKGMPGDVVVKTKTPAVQPAAKTEPAKPAVQTGQPVPKTEPVKSAGSSPYRGTGEICGTGSTARTENGAGETGGAGSAARTENGAGETGGASGKARTENGTGETCGTGSTARTENGAGETGGASGKARTEKRNR